MPAAVTHESLTEQVDSRGLSLAVDREAGLIRGVKILGRQSKNGREYTLEALSHAASLYNGKAVNIDHVEPDQRRSYADRIGMLRGVTVREGSLFGDLQFNPKHALAEQLIWDAEHAPENVGLSHDATGKTSRRDGRIIVEEITSVRSVDLVAEPATTRGLFESRDPHNQPTEETHVAETKITDLKEATLDQLRANRPDLFEAITRQIAEGAEAKAREAELKQLREEVAALKAEKARFERREAVLEELKKAGLDATNRAVVSDLFLESLLREEAPAKRQELIDDRKAILGEAARGSQTPQSSSRFAEDQAGRYAEKPIEKRVAAWQS